MFIILKLLCHIFGDKLANAMRFQGYSYLVKKHGHQAMHGAPDEPAWILGEQYDPRDPLTDAQLRDVYPKDYDDDDPPDNLHIEHIITHNLYKIDQECKKDLTTSLGDLLDEATKEDDYSFFSDMTPEQIGKLGWTWQVGKGMVRKPKPCCPHCHQELWWE